MKNTAGKSRYQREKKFLNEFCTNEKKLLSFEDLKRFKNYIGGLVDYQIRYLALEKGMITDFVEKREINIGGITLSCGLSSHGYDITLGEDLPFEEGFHLQSSLEHFKLPPFIKAHLENKSTFCRLNIIQPQSVIEAGWEGYITLEINIGKNNGKRFLAEKLPEGTPIAQITFEKTALPDNAYNGKYQNQGNYPVQAK